MKQIMVLLQSYHFFLICVFPETTDDGINRFRTGKEVFFRSGKEIKALFEQITIELINGYLFAKGNRLDPFFTFSIIKPFIGKTAAANK